MAPAPRGAALLVSLAALASCGATALASPPALPAAASAARTGYGPEPRVTLSGVEARAVALARGRLGEPRTSGALVLAARELARHAAAGDPDALDRRRVRAALARAGAHDPGPAAVLAVAPDDSAADAIARAIPRSRATHVGAGAAERDGEVVLVVLASERLARLDAFPREVAPGSAAALSGSLAGGLARPRVVVALPSGDVREAETSGGRDFRARVAFPEAGRYVVEVMADGAGGPQVAALLTVVAGGASLEAAAPPRRAAAPRPGDDAADEAAVLAAVNGTRRRRGLPPLQAAPELAAVARRHSAAMAVAGVVAHVLDGSGDLGARLRAARVPYRRAYENVARAETALEAHSAAEESPAHLGNVLARDATRVGVGIARGRLPSGDETVYLTEVFVQPPDDGRESRLTPDARVREALWRERGRAALPPLTQDPALDALAREAALSLRARDATTAPDLGDRALALRRGVAAVDVFVASAPAEAARSANLRDRRFRRVGVGVVTGDSRRFGAGRLFIAVIYTD